MSEVLDTAYEIGMSLVQGVLPDNRPEILKKISQTDWSTEQCHLYHRFLFAWAEHIKPSLIVETGTDRGYSAIHLAMGRTSAKVISIDNRSLCSDQLNALNVPNVDTITEDSLKVVDRFEDHSIDLLFLDSLHTCEHLSKEIELYVPKVRPGSLVFVDDISMTGEMAQGWARVAYPKRSIPKLHVTGFGAFQV